VEYYRRYPFAGLPTIYLGPWWQYEQQRQIFGDYNYIRLYQTVLKRIKPYFYAGVGYNLDYYVDIDNQGQQTLRNFTGYKYGTATGQDAFSSGATLNLLYDTRKNSIDPLPGFMPIYRIGLIRRCWAATPTGNRYI
jgi:hypothetical protein